jgi:signal transduction histidine kinase
MELVKHHMERKKIRMEVNCPSHIPPITCDPDRIKQALCNILSNAVKFSPENGTVAITCTPRTSGLEFSIQDHGRGMPKEHLSHLFDRYWQAKETSKQGSGLGLSIAKGIVESHHGRIWVESEEGAGSTFFIFLPREHLEVVSSKQPV